MKDNTPEFTPIEERDGILLKRDDLYCFAGIRGGKVRACRRIVAAEIDHTCSQVLSQYGGGHVAGLITASARKSPQMQIVSRIAHRLGLAARCHTASGAMTPEMDDAVAHGGELVQHKPGYNSVIIGRALEDAKARPGWTYIPFGMEHAAAMDGTRGQVESILRHIAAGGRAPKRIVITLGSGMSAAGVLHGLRDHNLKIPVVGVRIGADPTKRLDRWAPALWRRDMRVFSATPLHAYTDHVTADVGGLVVDGHYEAKAVQYLQPGDLFWIIGIRAEGNV